MFGGTISLYTLLANLLIVPLSSVYVGCTLLAGLVGMLPLPFCFSLGKVLALSLIHILKRNEKECGQR